MKVKDIGELIGGNVFTVEFKKKDGSLRSFECCGGGHKNFQKNVKGDKGSGAAYDFMSKGLLPVWIEKEFASNGKAGFRSVNLSTITRLKVDGKDYILNRGEIEEV